MPRPTPPSPPTSIGEARTAFAAVQHMRALLACEGWSQGMAAHILKQRDLLATRILDDDDLTPADREKLRESYKVHRDLLAWPERTLEVQLGVLERAGNDDLTDI